MHILQVAPYYPPAYAYGGIPRIVGSLSCEMVQHAHTVSVITTDAHNDTHRANRILYQREHGVHIYTAPNLSNRLAFQQQLYLPILTPQYFKAIQSHGPVDIIHLHGHRHLLNNVVLRWARRHQIPYVFTANGTLRRHEQKEWIKVMWDAFISGRIPFKANRCVVVSQADANIHRKWGISSNKLKYIPNGLDLREFHTPTEQTIRARYSIPEADPVIG